MYYSYDLSPKKYKMPLIKSGVRVAQLDELMTINLSKL